MAHALVMQVELVGSPEEADKMLHEIVVPMAQAQPGFKSGKWLHDGSGSGMGVVVFDTDENAEAAKGVLRAAARRSETEIVIGVGRWCRGLMVRTARNLAEVEID